MGEAFAGALEAAAGAFEGALGAAKQPLEGAREALAEAARSARPDAVVEGWVLARGEAAAGGGGAVGGDGEAPPGSARVGGAVHWGRVAELMDAVGRPLFFRRLLGVAAAQAEVVAAGAPARLRSLATLVRALAPSATVEGLLQQLGAALSGGAATIGDSAGGGLSLPETYFAWLQRGGSLGGLEGELYTSWAAWAFGLGEEGVFEKGAEDKLKAQPMGESGVMHLWGVDPAWSVAGGGE